MKIKLLIDENVHSGLAEALRKRGFDAVNVQELNIKGLRRIHKIIKLSQS